ncbi:MAG: hypothetical protein QM809_02650 [Gordonia sp. (in: high G+C Gram-positive bacteria)]|uniref:hypothetical protein n=1 Tax=Gordonia sp. (in: high G+C Gram-positive bacteria) TaxID=84139 RepID=UPI0039E2C7FC
MPPFLSPLKDAALFSLGTYAFHTIGLGPWVLWVGGALTASALARAAYIGTQATTNRSRV